MSINIYTNKVLTSKQYDLLLYLRAHGLAVARAEGTTCHAEFPRLHVERWCDGAERSLLPRLEEEVLCNEKHLLLHNVSSGQAKQRQLLAWLFTQNCSFSN